MTPERSLPDWRDALRLEHGDHVAVCVASDGSTSLWIVRPLCDHHQRTADHGSTADAAHEQLGPLTAAWRDRIAQARPRCPTHPDAPTTTTGRCPLCIAARLTEETP